MGKMVLDSNLPNTYTFISLEKQKRHHPLDLSGGLTGDSGFSRRNDVDREIASWS